jgi:hypothetical protein
MFSRIEVLVEATVATEVKNGHQFTCKSLSILEPYGLNHGDCS